ncbi:MAG: PAS domain S-box protein, partial [Verrucomicrobia bacterium]|nr:PAS domain S-box protein [Verrucomicrobiota bacterium]
EPRRRAKSRLRVRQPTPHSEADPRRLLQELQIHQVELEMQNAELQKARDELETALEKYTDLYDFAPVGYFSLDEQGRILEANLAGAALLGIERSRLINQRLLAFMAPTTQAVVRNLLEQVFAGRGKQVCEATLRNGGGATFWATFHGASAVSLGGPRKWCRVTVSDITTLKQAQEAQRRVEALSVTNQGLRREIIKRQEAEEALKQSEQHQTQLLVQSRHMQQQLRHLSHQILQAQEDERKRISRELHDEIVQTLVGIDFHLENLFRDATLNPRALKKKIAQTQRLVESLVNIVQQFARELRPTTLDDLGLIAALHSFMKDFTKRTGIRVHFTAFSGVNHLHSSQRTVLFRVVQSALSNVAQHARASRVKVSLRHIADAIHLGISDNGRAFAVERVLRARKNQPLGLLGMRERVEMLGGSFSVESAPGQGTTIRAQIPFADPLITDD